MTAYGQPFNTGNPRPAPHAGSGRGGVVRLMPGSRARNGMPEGKPYVWRGRRGDQRTPAEIVAELHEEIETRQAEEGKE